VPRNSLSLGSGFAASGCWKEKGIRHPQRFYSKKRFFFFFFSIKFFSLLTHTTLELEHPWKRELDNHLANKNSILTRINLAESNNPLLPLVKIMIETLDPDQSHDFSSLTLVNNRNLSALFERSIDLLSSKHSDTRSLFYREDWKGEATSPAEKEERKRCLAELGDYSSSFRKYGWNTGERVCIL